MSEVYGAIEAGGTKWVCAIGTSPDDVRALERFPTTTPEHTLDRAIGFLRSEGAAHGGMRGLGVACFGPIDLHPDSSRYGTITSTPKPGWADAAVVAPLREALGVPVAFETDVGGAAVGEWRWGAGRGVEDLVYMTVGTGIGGGVISGGRMVHGLVHPEIGHIPVRHDRARDPFEGTCPYHGDCLEGLASGTAMAARWGCPAEELPPDHEAWELEADYLAELVQTLVCILSPGRIVLGGGVLTGGSLLEAVRSRALERLGGYVRTSALTPEGIGGYVVAPGLGDRSGVLGALALAMRSAGAVKTDAR